MSLSAAQETNQIMADRKSQWNTINQESVGRLLNEHEERILQWCEGPTPGLKKLIMRALSPKQDTVEKSSPDDVNSAEGQSITGINVNVYDNNGYSPLYYAIERGDLTLIDALFKAHANLCLSTDEKFDIVGFVMRTPNQNIITRIMHEALLCNYILLQFVQKKDVQLAAQQHIHDAYKTCSLELYNMQQKVGLLSKIIFIPSLICGYIIPFAMEFGRNSFIVDGVYEEYIELPASQDSKVEHIYYHEAENTEQA
jgi:hypothetical protein